MLSQLPVELINDMIAYMVPHCHVLLHEDMLPNKSIYQCITVSPLLYLDHQGLYWIKDGERKSCHPFILCEEESRTIYGSEPLLELMDWTTFSYRNRIRCTAVNVLEQQKWKNVVHEK
jgi:hypothetical protein